MSSRFRVVVLLCILGSLPACEPSPPQEPPAALLRFGVFGDMPYLPLEHPGHAAEQAEYRAFLDTLDRRDLEFVVHVGDFTRVTCSDSLFLERLNEFRSIAHPLIYTPGDNEWTDCARDGYDPLERLARIREMFMTGHTSLGRRTIPLVRQSEDPGFELFRENVRWSTGGVTFITLHVVGTNNNWGAAAAPTEEYARRDEANLAWMRQAFRVAEREGSLGVAIFMQANPRLERGAAALDPGERDGFASVRRELHALALSFGRPVVLVHGDTHYFRVDKPFRHPATGHVLPNFLRVETFGDPDLHGLMITVDPSSATLFRVEPLLGSRGAAVRQTTVGEPIPDHQLP